MGMVIYSPVCIQSPSIIQRTNGEPLLIIAHRGLGTIVTLLYAINVILPNGAREPSAG